MNCTAFVVEIKSGNRWHPYSILHGPGLPDIRVALSCVFTERSPLLPAGIDRDRVRLRRLHDAGEIQATARYLCDQIGPE